MATTEKRLHLSLTKADIALLDDLGERFGETPSQLFKRALILLHCITFYRNTEYGDNGHDEI